MRSSTASDVLLFHTMEERRSGHLRFGLSREDAALETMSAEFVAEEESLP